MTDTPHSATERQFSIQRIYLKDVSFEAPNSPDIFLLNWQPQHQLSLNSHAKAIAEDFYEVVLSVTVTTKVADKTAFIVELQQAGLFGVRGFSAEELAPLLGAYCPNLLFPFAREALSDLATKGSFPQVLLQPINFDALFAQQQQQLKQAEAAAQGPADTP